MTLHPCPCCGKDGIPAGRRWLLPTRCVKCEGLVGGEPSRFDRARVTLARVVCGPLAVALGVLTWLRVTDRWSPELPGVSLHWMWVILVALLADGFLLSRRATLVPLEHDPAKERLARESGPD